MRIEFENWIMGQDISQASRELFLEALSCYRLRAYKASYILSHLGFQVVIRDRILSSDQPSGLSENLWDWIRTILMNNGTWDKEIFEIVQGNIPNIFHLSEDVRNQVLYWRNRRNEIIQVGGVAVDYSLVETFWQFIRANLGKFVVNGSKEDLLNEITAHFDMRKTPLDKGFSYLVEQIPDSVEPKEMTGFINDIYQIFYPAGDSPSYIYKDGGLRFFNGLFEVKDTIFIGKLVQFLINQSEFLLELFRAYPDKVIFFGNHKKFLRHLWFSMLFRPIPTNDFPVYCSLIRNALIPDSDLIEAHKHIIGNALLGSLPETKCLQILESTGFFEAFKTIAFNQAYIEDQAWGNANADLVVYYLSKFGLDVDIAVEMERVFSSEDHPDALAKKINSYLLAKFPKRKEFAEFFLAHDIGIPTHLTPLRAAVDVLLNEPQVERGGERDGR